jgi:hypothetical protein
MANIAVFMNTSGTQVSNGTVTHYNNTSGVVTFTVTPTVTGLNALYVKVSAPVTGSTQSTTLAFFGASGQGFFVDASGSTYTMPSSFTFSPTSGYVDGTAATMTIATTGASSTSAPIAVFYAASAGLTSAAGLVACGTGSHVSNAATVSVTIAPGTWYVYVRVTSPSGIPGPFIGTAATVTARAYIHATSISSVAPSVAVEGSSATFTVTLAGFDTAATGTASVYYATTNNSPSPTLLGSSGLPMVAGVVSVPVAQGVLALGSYFVYARTISPTLEQGPLRVTGSAAVTVRAYTFPTSLYAATTSSIYAASVSALPLTLAPADGLASGTITVFYHSTNSSTAPAQCGTGTVGANGTATVQCTFPTAGSFFVYARVTAPNGTAGALPLLCTPTTISVQKRPVAINFKTLTFASTSDAAQVTSTPTTFAAALPAGFTSTAAQTNLTSMRSYYRDSNGEWAPVSTNLVPAMVRCDFNGAASVGINAQATGIFAVIVVQCTTYRNNAPSVLWSSFPGGTKTSMSTASAYVQCATAPETALTFVAGVNAAGQVLSAVTRQTQVAFSVARVTGETARWYNGIKEQTSTVAFDATRTQTACLGAGGGVQLQDFVTVHQFSSAMQVSFDSINNSTYTTIGTGTSNTTPYACNVSTNRCGGARFGEFAVVQANLAHDELLSVARDCANQWRVAFAGPFVQTFRLVNTGTGSISLAYFALGSALGVTGDLAANLVSSAAYGSATYSASSGTQASSGSAWQGSTATTAPHQTLVAGSHFQVSLAAGVENAGFIKLGVVTFEQGAQLVMDVMYTNGAWERYDLWYHYDGAAVNATTSALSAVGANQTVYAKAGIFMPWKQKYRTNANEDPTMPYTLPQYDVSREGSAAYLATLSSNLMAITYDADRAVNWTIAQSRTLNATLTENQVLNLKQHSESARELPLSNFPNLATLVSATTTTDGRYNLSEIEATRYDYLPASVKTQYVSYVSAARDGIWWDGTTSPHHIDFTNLTMAFVDPTTLQAAHAVCVMNNERLDVNMRLRKSVTGKYYLDTPQTFDGGGTYIGAYRGYCSRPFVTPINAATRSMFGLTANDPSFGRTIDALDLQKKYTVCSFVCNTTLLNKGEMGNAPPIGDVMGILLNGASNKMAFTMTLSGSTCTEAQLASLGNYIRTSTQNTVASTFVPPKYRAMRTCTTSSNALNDIINFPNSASQERIFVFTVAIDTTVGGSNAFSSDGTMEQYVKVYINGKRINTAARKISAGSGYVTCTTSVGTTPTSYPSNFYPSSSLTYGISQVTDMTNNWSGGNPSGTTAMYGLKYSMAANFDATNARSFNSFGYPNPGSRRSPTNYGNRLIVLEAKTESRATQAYSVAEVEAHITQLSMKWGIVMAYRWITIKNTGTVDFRFARLGLYASHTEAIADVATGTTTDQKTGAFRNVMRGYTTGVASTVSSATVGSSGITAVLGNTTSVAPGTTDTTRVTIQPGGSVTIDLGDAVTCSHVLFGSLASTGDVTLARMTVELTPTLTESEAQGIAVTHALRAAKNASGVSEGQFPLYSPATQADTGPFVTAAGAHVNTCGVYVLFAPFWGRAYVGPTAFTYTTAGPVYVTAAAAVSITATGADATAATIVVYASTSATSTAPSVVCASAGLSAAGTGSATCVFPSTGTYYLFLKARGPDGTVQSSFVGSGSAPVSVVAYELPTSISDATIGALVVGTASASRTLTLSGPGISALTQPNITVYVGAPGNCTVTAYNTTSGLVTFTVTPTVSGMCSVYAVVAAPVAGSTQTTTLVYTGPTTQGFFVDATGSNYTMPTSFTYAAPGCVDGNPTTMTVTATGASAAAAPIAVFYGASAGSTTTAALTQCGAGSLASGTSNVTVAIPTGTWYVYIRVTSPMGAVGPIVGAAATLTVRAYVHATSVVSFTPTTVVDGATTSIVVTLGGYDTGSTGTAAVYYAATNNSASPTLVGTAALVAGVVTVSGAIPLGTYYVYARTVSPSSVQGPLRVSATQVTSRAYTHATSVVSFTPTTVTGGITTSIAVTLGGYDTGASGTAAVYYATTNNSASPTLVGTAAPVAGVGTVSGAIPAGTYYVYARTISPSSVQGPLLVSATQVTSRALDRVFWPVGREGNSLSSFCNAMWDETIEPFGFTTHPVVLTAYPSLQQIATYWIKYVDLTMYVWSDGTPIDVASFPTKFGAVGPFFSPSYYNVTFPFHAYQIMTPLSWRVRYYFETCRDFKWGYSVPTYANRIAMCLDNDLQGNGDQTPNDPTPVFDYHNSNGTTWKLWGYPNKNYNTAERVLIGTFSTANCIRSRGTYKWTALSWPSGQAFTHYLWQPSTYAGPSTWRSCPPILAM